MQTFPLSLICPKIFKKIKEKYSAIGINTMMDYQLNVYKHSFNYITKLDESREKLEQFEKEFESYREYLLSINCNLVDSGIQQSQFICSEFIPLYVR